MDVKWTDIPAELRYVYELQVTHTRFTDLLCRHLFSFCLTGDATFHAGQLMKNSNPDDMSLSSGNGYFPPDSIYIEYLKKLVIIDEVSQPVMPSQLPILTS